jgi:hypothetical protein
MNKLTGPISVSSMVLASCRSVPPQPSPPAQPSALQPSFERAAEAVRAELGVRIDDFALNEVDHEELADSVLREAFLSEGPPADETVEQMRRAAAEVYARGLFARYSLQQHEVLIRPANFEDLAELLEMPAVNSEGQVMCVLLHERVHAAQEELYAPSQVIPELRGADAVRAHNAVLEGHAQFVARRVAERLGLADAFETFTRSIAKAARPPSDARSHSRRRICRGSRTRSGSCTRSRAPRRGSTWRPASPRSRARSSSPDGSRRRSPCPSASSSPID